MAESVLGGLIGEEEAVAEAGQEAAQRAGAEAFAASLAAQQAAGDPKVARAAEHFLRRQAHFLDLQAKELAEQHTVRLAQLESLYREGKMRRLGQGIRVGMQSFLALVVGLIAIGVVVMVYDAFTSHQVVVDSFQAPPALAASGVTGEVVASGVLDTLQKLQDATRTTDKQLRTSGAWASDVKVDVPETGVSLGEIIRLLHQRFGHDLHITGELVQTGSGGLSLTVRGDGVPAATFAGGPQDLSQLTTKAAEYVYGRSQPLQYATFLYDAGRAADAVVFDQSAFPRARSDAERSQLANSWGNAYASLYQPAPAVEKYRLAMSFAKPRSQQWWKIWGNLIGTASVGQGEEAGWREGRALLKAAAAAPKRERPGLPYLVNASQQIWDLPLQLASMQADAKRNGGAGATNTIDGPAIADIYWMMHDPEQAARYLASSDPTDPITKAEALLVQGYGALDRGDVAAALGPLQAFWKAWLADPNLQYTYNFQGCYAGLALGLTGHLEQAETIFKRVGWSPCYAFEGDVLAHAGKVSDAQKAWAEGQRVAPDLPAVPLHRGLYELGQGQLEAAEADEASAASKAPHWADPWKAWGDVLAREGRWKDALGKYDEALKYAPAWAELKQARAAAAGRAGNS
jgi:tetratricopeptide (TPR) repeat protein